MGAIHQVPASNLSNSCFENLSWVYYVGLLLGSPTFLTSASRSPLLWENR